METGNVSLLCSYLASGPAPYDERGSERWALWLLWFSSHVATDAHLATAHARTEQQQRTQGTTQQTNSFEDCE